MRTSWLIAALALAGCSSIVSSKLDEKPSSGAVDASVAMDALVAMDTSIAPDAWPASCVDIDGDNFVVGGEECGSTQDCDDNNPNIYPGAEEVCDGEDADCNGDDDQELVVMGYVDQDGDGFGVSDGVATPVLCPRIIAREYSFNNDDCLDVGDDAYCVNPLFPESPTDAGGCSNNPDDFPFDPYELPRGGTSWDYDCDGIVEKQHTENISCLAPENDEMCSGSPGAVACSDGVGIMGTAVCGESVMVWTCRGASFCGFSETTCRDSQYSSKMGCR